MPSDPPILAFDTSAAHCAAALLCGDAVIESRAETLAKGQAERLLPFLQEILNETGHDWRDLARIGVGIGPGNFTGIRISVAAARGLALGLGIPAIGVSTLDAIAYLHFGAMAAVTAPRDMLYAQPPGGTATLRTAADVANPVFAPEAAALAEAIASCAASADAAAAGRPKPLYIKPADAAPSRIEAPVILP
ncbi:tRNA (adenosine(37)-N6)-threonylcarbamoyltransferase complex dimerization subunit type 1 TsaB [Marivita sp. GX14005]|uniref:tRNA (adenosine(37)-N6)-threonylcarbamoyltransferase complex dimerization subunit type 1 TsaB n=1 Tax=Marivita sp. GX14005 TaxID=2942276 RepID=UPI0020198E65|nr:tRNA (adenosine(37)-N6)-threonylcarbamoyltransferase complex dimerization subunit type 1 TsaB [Marivita sp. GX14005]MCL3881946.1 tRNA (adenosine(37)-N6)-threonylcarbamoyltransferase complex dimerization subunit type 1 TsaB [Marivita sp. GX14005]